MNVESLSLEGLKLITCNKIGDDRGFFCERFREDVFAAADLPTRYVQENYSRSAANVLRGLHYQYDPPQGKLVTCLRGTIVDVVVDIRAQSKTFGQHLCFALQANQPQWLWVPAGFAHGFCVTSSEGADILYKVTDYYRPAGEGGIAWQDPDLKIQWAVANPILSARDLKQPSFKDYASNPVFI